MHTNILKKYVYAAPLFLAAAMALVYLVSVAARAEDNGGMMSGQYPPPMPGSGGGMWGSGSNTWSSGGNEFIRPSDDKGKTNDFGCGKGGRMCAEKITGSEGKPEMAGPSFTVNPEGKVQIIGGEVVEVNWPNLKVKIWGGLAVNVHIMPDAKIEGHIDGEASSTAASASVGDKVDVKGYADREQNLIHGIQFRNRSQVSRRTDEIYAKIRQLQEQLKQLMEQLRSGR